ncbi:hypothetical protein AB0J14_38400 [Micromonospora arborensis]|uniref:hypothetical protein n=1 Tax=Micromonospora arborensis TaxID=2116518 RepID=UPI0033DDFDA1
MAILRKAYVPVLPDTSKFDKELKDKLKKTDVGPEGDQVGKAFSSSLTRRIDRELKKFDLPTLDLKGNPADAIKAIESASRRLEELRDDADSIELRVQANKALGDLGRFRKTLGDFGPDLGATLGVSTSQGFFATLGASFKAPPPAVFAGVGVLGAAMVPTLAAAVSGAVVGGVGVGGVIGGVVLAARDDRVKSAGASLGAFILGDLQDRASGFVPVVLDGIDDIRAGWATLGPDLDRIFKSSRFVEPLVAGAISGGRRIVGGLADVIDDADPVVASLGASFDRLGDAVGDTLSTLAQDADEGASAIDDLSMSVANFVRVTGAIIHGAAAVKGFADQVDIAIDRGRYWTEDWMSSGGVLKEFGIQLDLTADGFKAGSKEAEAYRRAGLGTAEASDFATLKLAGMTDAQIAAADSSGTFASKTDEVNGLLGRSTGRYIETASAAAKLQNQTKLLGEVQNVASQEMDALLTRTGAVTGAMQAQKSMADLLRNAHDQMFGSVIRNSEANETYESSWDGLSSSIGTNGRSLNIHTQAGRANRDALQDLLGRTNELFYAEIETGTSVAGATKKHQDRIAAVKEEARRLGLNKVETQKLIETYGQIPPAKKTDLMLEGLQSIGKALTDLYVFQRSLATGRTLAQVRSDLFGGYAGNPRVFKAEGGPIPGSSPSDTADNIPIMATADEYMIRRRSARKLGRSTLDYINQRGELPPVSRYAAGGSIERLVGKSWGSIMRYPVNVSGSYVMSKSEAADKVVTAPPAGGATAPWMSQVLRRAFPQLALISGFRAGSTTLSGSQSYHALNRAVDYPANRDMARWVFSNYKARTKEFISPFQEYNIHNGQRHTYTGAVWNQHNFAGGNAHNHWAMANGGVIPEPVFGVGASGRTYSFAERGPETVVPNGGAMRLHPADLAALAGSRGETHYHLHDSAATVAQLEAMQHRQVLQARLGRPR